MSYHIVSIDAPECSLTASRGQLICRSSEGERKLPLEDVAAIVVTSFKATFTNALLVEIARYKIGFILCESYRPTCVVLPVDRATDTDLLRKLSSLPSQFKRRLWEKTLSAKCYNQFVLAVQWDKESSHLARFERLTKSSLDTREAECARLFWKIFSSSQLGEEEMFRRGRFEGGANALFNYAYAVLLSQILQKLLAIGLDPTFGIFHAAREHATPLAYDLMEPFRPCFDAQVVAWLRRESTEKREEEASPYQVSREFRQHIVATLKLSFEYGGREMELSDLIELVCRSFRKAVVEQEVGLYQPWKTSITKWAGFS